MTYLVEGKLDDSKGNLLVWPSILYWTIPLIDNNYNPGQNIRTS